MDKKTRNYYYWLILNKFGMNLAKNYFELTSREIADLTALASAMRCKGEDGKSQSRTLWDRALSAGPF